MIDEAATRAFVARRARRIQHALYRNGARAEYFKGDQPWSCVNEYWMLADWLDTRESISGAYEDRARLDEDEQRAPATRIAVSVPNLLEDDMMHWPWENYLRKSQWKARRRKKRRAARALAEANKPPKPPRVSRKRIPWWEMGARAR